MKRIALGLVIAGAAAAPAFAEPPLAAVVAQESPTRNAVQFDASAARVGARAEIALPGGVLAPLTIEAVKPGRVGAIIQAHADGEHPGTTVLSVTGSAAFGTIQMNGQTYTVDTGRDGIARITAGMQEPHVGPDNLALPSDLATAQAAPDGGDTAAAIPAGNAILDVGMFYTQSMVTRYGLALGARMNTLLDRLNLGLSNSSVPMTAVLGDLEQINYSESATLDVMLPDLRNGANNANGNLAPALTARAAKGLDIISAHRVFDKTAHNSCGLGYVPGSGGAGTLDNQGSGGFNVVDDGQDIGGTNFGCSIYTFAHETGHNMGLAHNREDANVSGVFPYSYGYRVPGVFRTIMAYQSDQNESITPYFSDPLIIACGTSSGAQIQACGRPIGAADAADNAESLRLADTGVQPGNSGLPRGAPGFRTRAPDELVAAVLPASRSVQVNGTATAFATMINSGGAGTATLCGLDIAGAPAGSFSYQTTNPATNQPTGAPNTPVNIPPNGVQTFVFSLKATSAFSASDIPVQFFCANRRSATAVTGLNTFLYGATTNALVDMIALADTVAHDGTVTIPGAGQSAAFVVAAANVGAAGAVIASVDTANAPVPVAVSICQTNSSGQCLAAPTFQVTTPSIPANGTASFSIFVTAQGSIPFDPAASRIFVRFRNSGVVVGATSVAVRTS